jgi:hypothetical protein
VAHPMAHENKGLSGLKPGPTSHLHTKDLYSVRAQR